MSAPYLSCPTIKSTAEAVLFQSVDKVYFHAGTALARQRAFKSVGYANASKPEDVYLGLETFGRPCFAKSKHRLSEKRSFSTVSILHLSMEDKAFSDSYSVGRSLRHAPVL